MFIELVLLYFVHATNAALLLWTPKPILFPAFMTFTNNDYRKLLNDMNNPQVLAYQANSLKEALNLQSILGTNNAVYLTKPGIDIFEDIEVEEINDETNINFTTRNNTLVVLIMPEALSRIKRNDDNSTITNEEVIEDLFVPQTEPLLTGSVLYTAAVEQKDVMVYSSKPLLLYINDININLGNASSTFIDVRERDSIMRLITRFTTVNNRIMFVRFIFSIFNGYWYLNVIEVEVNSIRYNLVLTSKNNVTAPNRMSYHCEDETVYSDPKSNISLYLYDLQVQPDARHYRFSDAYNCIPFTTGPILSGLLVVSIMCIGLAIGLMALASIKTMDKFDNSKTKQLTISLFE